MLPQGKVGIEPTKIPPVASSACLKADLTARDRYRSAVLHCHQTDRRPELQIRYRRQRRKSNSFQRTYSCALPQKSLRLVPVIPAVALLVPVMPAVDLLVPVIPAVALLVPVMPAVALLVPVMPAVALTGTGDAFSRPTGPGNTSCGSTGTGDAFTRPTSPGNASCRL
jgi:hypothetical protein